MACHIERQGQGMDENQFKVLVKSMKSVWADPKFVADEYAYKLWYALLKDLSYEECATSLQRYMQTNKFPPTPADIRMGVEEIERNADGGLSETELMSLITRATRNSTYHSEEEFAKLPEICQKAVGSPTQLRMWAAADESDASFMQVQTMKTLRTELARAKSDSTVSLGVRSKMQELQDIALKKRNEQKALDAKTETVPEIEQVEPPKRISDEDLDRLTARFHWHDEKGDSDGDRAEAAGQ